MIRILIISVLMFNMISCNKNLEINTSTVDNLKVYQDAKDLIYKNVDSINSTLAKQKVGLTSGLWNSYYFENSILPENPELEKLKLLWSNNYVSNDREGGLIHYSSNNLVGFVTFYESGFFKSITHMLVFSEKEFEYPWPDEIFEKKEIDSNWTYLILVKANG